MNKRVATSILKKYEDPSTRDEAVKLAEEHGYALHIQIDAGEYTLTSVADTDTIFTRADADVEPEVSESVEQAAQKAAPSPKETAPKK